ncbi:hypothetical protein E5N72_16760 [Pseudoalteromonas sp. MEBiC 03607]|nr:hypothetical protein [Pseudoalteromonadaceae bacterium]TGV21604.1 hypothetical protein E5N72_16760 [Pseudoalteromonas sp. MEBiC 03607]HCV02892.1 hypothetical protein [Pseudoalteromonas sp.]
MMRLSRKAWNNVVIISMLLMIFFFNGLHKKLNTQPVEEGVQALLPEQSFILAMAFPELKIERIGTSWRSQSLQEASWQGDEQQLEQLVELWQHQKLTIASLPVSQISQSSADYVASVWLAGEQLPAVYQLYHIDSKYYLLDKRLQRVFVLEQADAAKLFPLYPF